MRGRAAPCSRRRSLCPRPRRRTHRRRGRRRRRVNDGLFDAQTELVLSGPDAAGERRRARPHGLQRASCATTHRSGRSRRRRRHHGRRSQAAAHGRPRTTTAPRSPPPAAPPAPRCSAAPTPSPPRPPRRGDADTARRWLLLREFRTATRFTRPGASGTLALDQLGRGTLDAQGREPGRHEGPARRLPGAAARAARRRPPRHRAGPPRAPRRGRPPRPPGYFAILAPRYAEDRGAPAAEQAHADVRRRSRRHDLGPARRRRQALEGFTAAPFTPEEAARRAQQLLQFLALVPVEYGRGVKDTQRHARLRDPGGRRLPHRRRRRARGPARPARQARRAPAPRRPPTRSTELGKLVEFANQEQGRRRHPRAGRGGRDHGPERAQGRDAEGVDGEDRRVRLRPDRAHAGPHGGRGRRRPVPPGRAGAAGGLRVLRVRARSAACAASTRASRWTSRA